MSHEDLLHDKDSTTSSSINVNVVDSGSSTPDDLEFLSSFDHILGDLSWWPYDQPFIFLELKAVS